MSGPLVYLFFAGMVLACVLIGFGLFINMSAVDDDDPVAAANFGRRVMFGGLTFGTVWATGFALFGVWHLLNALINNIGGSL